MITETEIEEQTLSSVDEDPGPCPSNNTHIWDDSYKLGNVCRCSTWQIIELIDPIKFLAIDFNGIRAFFDRILK